MTPGTQIVVTPSLRPGTIFMTPYGIIVRHMSELLLGLSGAAWRPERTTCPTWDGECRCMLGGEA